MCGGGGGGSQTVTQVTQVPQFMQDYFNWQSQQQQDLYNTAKGIFSTNQNYINYPGERINPLTTDQTSAMEMIRNNAGLQTNPTNGTLTATGQGPLGMDSLGTASAMNSGAAKSWLTPGVSSGYMSPYVGDVVNTTMNELGRQQNLDQQKIDDQATAAGAYGGDRQAVADAMNSRNYAQTKASTLASLLNQGYYGANSMFNADQQRLLAASQNAAGLGAQAQQMGNQAASSLMGVGNVGQQQGQQYLNQYYNDFLNQRQWPYQNFGFLESAMRAQPFAPLGSTQTSQVPTQGALQQVAGLGLTGAMIGNLAFGQGGFMKKGGLVTKSRVLH